ncbi:MAG: SusC/RagA family TonB-linked outer membrane protein, partial [Bacteroidetes bacterium]
MKINFTKTCLSLMAMLLWGHLLQAQFTVTGTVTDENGDPLVGVTVLEKGTTRGVITDGNGKFSLDIPGESSTLVFSYIGFATEEVEVSPQNSKINLSLREDIARLDEVVITGLASGVKRANSGNAVTSVTAEDLTGKTDPQTLDYALYGKVPGVLMSSNSGAPGGGINMQLRGISTLGAGSSQPLFIIDGVYVDNSVIRTGRTQVNGASGGQNAATQDDAANRIADLNPDDIEKIEILKGPSAAAIYGTRANAGVVIITTKRGQAGKTKVSFNQSIGFAQGQNFQHFGVWDRERTEINKGNDPDELAA